MNSGSALSAWRLFANDILDVHRALRRANLPDAKHRLIWRTSFTGHPSCKKYSQPLPRVGDSLEGLLACRKCVEEWAWHLYPIFDRAAQDQLESIGALSFDIRPMTALRPDAHTENEYGRDQSHVVDCLHLALPGVPDWWGALLLATMETCAV